VRQHPHYAEDEIQVSNKSRRLINRGKLIRKINQVGARLRQTTFLGLRDDNKPTEVVLEPSN
jgi:hypothetical protein